MAPPPVDLVLIFRTASSPSTSSKRKFPTKPLARQNAQQASAQYNKLLETLRTGGLRAVGKRGERAGQLLVLVSCPEGLLRRLAVRERHSDFLSGLPTAALHAQASGSGKEKGEKALSGDLDDLDVLLPADRLRLVHSYITATQADGGLGVAPESEEWDRVEGIMALHDTLFNDTWIKAWTTRQLGLNVEIDKIKTQFGEAVALYFLFLQGYTKFLVFISAVGAYFFFVHPPYSTTYSTILLIWSVTFVEWWRIQQRLQSVRWGTKGSFRVERRRAQYQRIGWWRRELRMLSSVPVIALFAGVLGMLLTGIFVFEAFVTQLYKGPGSKLLSFLPTVLFVLLVPRVLAIYHTYAVRFTNWEQHSHQSTHDASLTIKTFSLAAIVSYGGLALSAFVYVPFGEEVMSFVQLYLFHAKTPLNVNNIGEAAHKIASTVLSTFASGPTAQVAKNLSEGFNNTHKEHLWDMDGGSARSKLNPRRLQEQMFAITATNQVVNTFLEIGLPYVMRAVESVRAGKGLRGHSAPAKSDNTRADNGKSGDGEQKTEKKRVSFEDEDAADAHHVASANGREARELMERVHREVALPEYTLFADYSEMVTQFGYVALWSTIWPLAPVMSLANNWLELRSDAFKIATHARRPIPSRTDTIGPWLDALTFITWLAALTNSALVYLFRPADQCRAYGTTLQHNHQHFPAPPPATGAHGDKERETRQLLLSAAVIALAASHGYILLRSVVRHLLERVLWKGSKEEREAERLEAVVKMEYLKSIGVEDVAKGVLARTASEMKGKGREAESEGEGEAFWEYDEGLEELSKGVKDA